jgi:undecaprenyl-diphosphatase
MNDLIQAIILGILQGLTEFLPISSSAHLILLPWILGWQPLGIVFDVVIHGGTLLAVLAYFREDWKFFVQDLFRRIRHLRPFSGEDPVVDAVLWGTLPAVLVALAFKDSIEVYARRPLVTVFTLALFGLLLWWADRKKSGDRECSSVTLRDGILVGLAQSLALVPGVSRSGITITAALLLGFSRRESARFSFLLAGPVILLGAVSGVLSLVSGIETSPATWQVMVAGVTVSFVVGFLCIKYFLRFLESRTFLPFVIYRLALAGLILFLSWRMG